MNTIKTKVNMAQSNNNLLFKLENTNQIKYCVI